MKNLKKIGALLLVVVLMLSLSVTAFADAGAGTWVSTETGGQKDIWKNADGITSIPVTVQIDTASQVPATKFSYTITQGTAVDSGSGAIKIYAGPTDGVTLPATPSVSFTANDSDKVETLTLTVDATKFTHAGVYRYVLTQTALTEEQKSIGLGSEGTDGAAVGKYLDLYVENAGSAGTYKVTNAVLANTVQDTLQVSGGKVTYATGTKTDRFVNTFGKSTTPDPSDPDKPKSENYTVTITKSVTGASADKTFQFPFTITLGYENPTTDDTDTTLVGMTVGVSSTTSGAVPGTTTDMTIGEKTTTSNGTPLSGFKLADGQSITLTNVPKDVLVSVQENVDAGEGYTITYTAADFQNGNVTNGAVSVVGGTDTHADAGNVVTLKKVDAKNASITYINNREAISPTGVVLRVAPYALMLGVGLFLVLFSRKRREAENEE